MILAALTLCANKWLNSYAPLGVKCQRKHMSFHTRKAVGFFFSCLEKLDVKSALFYGTM